MFHNKTSNRFDYLNSQNESISKHQSILANNMLVFFSCENTDWQFGEKVSKLV